MESLWPLKAGRGKTGVESHAQELVMAPFLMAKTWNHSGRQNFEVLNLHSDSGKGGILPPVFLFDEKTEY